MVDPSAGYVDKGNKLQKTKFKGDRAMKKVLVVLAVVMGLALATSAHAQMLKYDSGQAAEQVAKAKPFQFSGIEIVSVDPKAQTVMFKGPKGNTGIARMNYAKFEGEYKGVSDLKPGDKVSGEGVVVDGQNWITKVRMAQAGEKPAAGPKKD